MITGLTTDGHFVIDDRIDDRGRMVVDAANHVLDDGTTWTHIPQSFIQDTSDTLGLTENLGHLQIRALGETVVLSETLSRRVTRAIAEDVTLSESFANDHAVALTVTGLSADGRMVFGDLFDDSGRAVVRAAGVGTVGLLADGTTYVLIPAAFGGFTQSVADTVALSESFSRAVATTKQDTVALTETLAKVVSRAAGDSLGLSETMTRRAQTRVQEDLGISEALNVQQVRIKSFADALSTTEALSGGQVLPIIMETFALTESMQLAVQKTFTEALGLNEFFNRVTGKRLDESLGLTESFTALAVRLKALSETVALTETLSKRVIRAIAEDLTLTENLAAAPSTGGGSQVSQSTQDDLTLTEELVRTIGRRTSDALDLGESWQHSANKLVGDALGLSEDLRLVLARVLGIAEPLVLTEAFAAILVRVLSLGDDLTLGETLDIEVTSIGVRHVGVTVFETCYLNSFVELRP